MVSCLSGQGHPLGRGHQKGAAPAGKAGKTPRCPGPAMLLEQGRDLPARLGPRVHQARGWLASLTFMTLVGRQVSRLLTTTRPAKRTFRPRNLFQRGGHGRAGLARAHGDDFFIAAHIQGAVRPTPKGRNPQA